MGRIHGKKITSYSVLLLMTVLLLVCLRPGELFVEVPGSMNAVRLKHEEVATYDEKVSDSVGQSSFTECKVFGIEKLIRDYYDAYLHEDDNELLKYIDTYGNLDMDMRAFARKNVEQYMDIRCYYMEGFVKDTYLVVSYGYAKYHGINTAVPVVGTFYVRANSGGNYYISNSAVSDDGQAYNELMFEDKQVQEIKNMAAYELDTACEVDGVLRVFVENNEKYFVY